MLEENPVPIRRRRPEVPEGIETFLTRCLARDPNDRYPNAATMRAAGDGIPARSIGKRTVKGRAEPIEVYALGEKAP